MSHLPHVIRASVPTLDLSACAAVGARLAGVREASGVAIAQLSEALLLSPRQVRALERVEVAAFHNTAFYLAALRKYVAYMGLPGDLLEDLVEAAPDPAAEAVEAQVPGITMRVMSALFGI